MWREHVHHVKVTWFTPVVLVRLPLKSDKIESGSVTLLDGEFT